MYLYFLILIILVFIYMHIEAKNLKIENVNLSSDKDSIKIAHLSDIHIGKMFVSLSKIKKTLETENPDFILLSGDYIESKKDIPKFLKFLDNLPQKPIYAIFGNHDYKAFLKNNADLNKFAEQLEYKGISLLRNKNTTLTINNRKINIVGIDDIRYKKHDVENAFLNLNESSNTTIVFSHNPDIIFSMTDKSSDILLTGHFHGGQIWVPFHFEFKLLRKEKLSKMKIYKGLNNINGQKIYISRGLGNVVLPFRFLSRPEITFIKI